MATPAFELDDLTTRDLTKSSAAFADADLEVLIQDAVDLVDSTCPTVQSRLTAGTLKLNVYKRRVADMILRVTKNPDGYQSESEGGASYSRLPVVASGALWMTQADIDALNGVTPRGRSGPSVASIGVDTGWGPLA